MFKIPKLLVLAFSILFFSSSYSQDKTIDSLKIVLRNTKVHDTTKLQAIADVMDNYYSLDDKNYYYLNTILGNLALKNYKKGNTSKEQIIYAEWLAAHYSIVANRYSQKAMPEKALAYHDKAIAILRSIKSYDEMYVVSLNKAAFYAKMEKNKEAIPLIYAALKFYEKDPVKYAEQMSYALTMMANVYSSQNQYEKAISYDLKAIGYYDAFYAKNSITHTLYLKALCYGHIAFCYTRMKEYNQSIIYNSKALAITKKIGADSQTAQALARMGEAHTKLGHFEEAEKLYQEVLGMKSLTVENDNLSIAMSTLGLGLLNFEKGDLDKANLYSAKGFALSKETGNIALQKQGADLLYTINIKTKNFEKALEMYKYYEKIVDSTQILEAKGAFEKQQLQYDFEKKELNYKLVSQKKAAVKNNWLIALSGAIVVLLLGVYFYYRNNKQKHAIAGLEKNQIKQKLLITQMNPHFIFNSIDNIQGLIHDKKDSDAVNYLSKFSKLTRQILENSNENYISLSEEVEMIENYLSIQQLLYSNKFDYKVDVEDAIDTEAILLPPMLTQPFIENAIKHGLGNKDKNGMIEIHFYLKESKLFFEVSDNGKGFDAEKKVTNHKSLAMTITKERLVNYTKNADFIVQADNIKDTNENIVGAKISFEIPYIYEN
ncbi:tetratricopeptide (TPR) repeat protein [Flavobacterium gossypii]|uniref:Tetratricopeptide (TPR) repeat protein n=1 Tax=Flavobacterium gossypii TaxID=1646119 RepID=A0ABR6DQG2_9FLAO|nr:tetratricopeptide repeat protein [Flavobacterium gossypii]MBA9073932.1 tetratricopeptide (TPR) repeat protein [Flavobacterium gossypii]